MASAPPDPLIEMLDCWDKSSGKGRDEDRARQLAKDYVANHPDQFADLQGVDLGELVSRIDQIRTESAVLVEGGMPHLVADKDAEKLRIDTYLLGTVPKQFVGAPWGQNQPAEVHVEAGKPNG